MSDASEDGNGRTRGDILIEEETSRRAGASVVTGWAQRPATGRSFLTMMVLAVLATGFALFLALRVQAKRDTEQSEAAVTRSGRKIP
jgi:hypothetical protein